MPHDPKHIQRLATAPHVKRAFPFDVDPIRWSTHIAKSNGTPEPPVVQPRGKVYPRIAQSRWIVECPFCPGAQDASPEHPIFWCTDCAMEKNGSAPIVVAFPPNYQQIEAVLMTRPDPRARNWYPSETLGDLINENRAYGYPVPPGVE